MAKRNDVPFLVTMVDMAGNVQGPSAIIRCTENRESLLSELGKLTRLSPSVPNRIPLQPDYSKKKIPEPELEYDEYWDSDKCKHCVSTYFRDDITSFYYYVENIEKCLNNPRFQKGEFTLVGTLPPNFRV